MRWIKGQFLLLLILSTISVNYCLDKYLKGLSKRLAMGMNLETNYCDDFYHFACGKIAESDPLQQFTLINDFEMMKRNFFNDIKDTFERTDIYASNEKFLMEKQYYDACMDVAPHSVSKAMDTYKNILSLTMMNEKKRWQDVAKYYASEIGDAFLFHFSLSVENILQVLRPFHLKLTDVNYDWTTKIIDDFLLSNCDGNSNCPRKMFRKQFYEFAHEMNKIVNEKPMILLTVTIRELQEMYDSHYFSVNQNSNSQINWLKFLQAFAGNNGQLLKSSHNIIIDSIYLKELPSILASTSSKVIINYMMFNFEYHDDLRFYSFDRHLVSPYDRSHQCISSLPITKSVVNILMNNNEFKKKEQFFREQFNFISERMKEEFQNSWLNDTLKEWVIQEIENVTLDILETRSKHNPFTREKIITSYDFAVTSNVMQNYFNFKKAQADRMVKIYLENGNLLTSNHGRKKRAVSVDIKYIPLNNKILMEPTYLSVPMFYQKAPLAYNFGKLGHLVAHELSHAVCFEKVLPEDSVYFKDRFILYNFEKNTRCLANQYTEKNVDGYKTLKENYADNLGLKVAYNAMKYVINKNLMAENLYSLPTFQEYTSEQMFFLSFANNHCTMSTKISKTSRHSPESARVNIPLMNMKEFAQAFYCPIDSPMNPSEKCDFWNNEYLNN